MREQMNSEYGRHTWVLKNSMVELQNADFAAYKNFWGDEFRWTALLPFAWKLIDNHWLEFPDLALYDSDEETAFNSAISIWSAAIHLLGLGMGWSDIEKGLAEWETLDFATGYHPVLDLVKKLCGDELDLLEFHIRQNRGIYGWVFSQIDEAPEKVNLERNPRSDPDEIQDWAADMAPLGRLLLHGGSDPLHLSPHFRDSVIGDDEFSRDFKLDRLRGDRYVLRLPRYAKWPLQLKNCGAQERNEIGEFLYESVDVQIENLGSIGLFVGGGGQYDRRRFRYSETYKEIKAGSQYISHYWGI